jgi:glycosyltransferase involved in cell wall biosynthesis
VGRNQVKIAIFSPYLGQHFGGGEKHILDIASFLSHKHQVSAFFPQIEGVDLLELKSKYESMFEIDLSKVSLLMCPLSTKARFYKKLAWTSQFDYLYALSDGSLFFSLAKTNNLHLQVPFTDQKKSLLDRLKLKNWQIKNTNSKFTKGIIEKNWRTKIDFVHYPKITILKSSAKFKKKPIILSVGRFFTHLHSKRQDILIEVFAKLSKNYPKEMKNWTLVLAGAIEDQDYYSKLLAKSKGLRIKFMPDCSRKELEKVYSEASIFWHAAGYEVDEAQAPNKVEHFGITTLEAMSAGVVPLVHLKGGQREILWGDLSELGWLTMDDCVEKTLDIIKNESKRKSFQKKCLKRVRDFDSKAFETTLNQMMEITK